MDKSTELYGLKILLSDEWWVDGNGVVFHTPFIDVARAQQEYLQAIFGERYVRVIAIKEYMGGSSPETTMELKPILAGAEAYTITGWGVDGQIADGKVHEGFVIINNYSMPAYLKPDFKSGTISIRLMPARPENAI